MPFKTLTLATASLLAVAAAPAANAAKPFYGDWGYDRSAMDSSVKPGDDFWAYVNGDWDKKTQIAADRASAGPFVTLSDKSEADVRKIVEQLANDPNRDHLGQQVGDFYSSFMDTSAIEAAGTAPLKPYLAEINGAKTRAPNGATRSPIFGFGTVMSLSTIRWLGWRRPFVEFGSMGIRRRGASRSAVVKAQTVIEAVASKRSS